MAWPDLERTALTASGLLGVPIRLAAARRPLRPSALTAGEAARWRALPPGPRRNDWLLGRTALRRLLGPGDPDTSGLSFPHRRWSLTHAGGVAFAVACDTPVGGVGIDFEPARTTVDPRAGRFFLRPAEQDWLAALPQRRRARALLRLWTAKEALYKATPDNGGALLGDYRLADPGAACGQASGPGAGTLHYVVVALDAGPLSVAVREEACDVAV